MLWEKGIISTYLHWSTHTCFHWQEPNPNSACSSQSGYEAMCEVHSTSSKMNRICFACQYPWREQYSCKMIQATLQSCSTLPPHWSSEWAWARELHKPFFLESIDSWFLNTHGYIFLGINRMTSKKSLLFLFRAELLFKLCNTTWYLV